MPGLSRFVILEDPLEEARAPPLVPMKLLEAVDSLLKPKPELLSLRLAEVTTKMVTLPTGHQTASLMCFGRNGWELPEERVAVHARKHGGNRFVFRNSSPPFEVCP